MVNRAWCSMCVSIPNGKPILFRPWQDLQGTIAYVSFNPKREAHPLQTLGIILQSVGHILFQSQTGSPSSSDHRSQPIAFRLSGCFNPKREAHPLQTRKIALLLTDFLLVSIPNGKPILFRQRMKGRLHGADELFQSQTGSPSSSDALYSNCRRISPKCFNPKREAHPLQTADTENG